jgi:hypothetical protein
MYPRAGHRTIVGALAAPLRFLQPTLDDIERFLANRKTSRSCLDSPQRALDRGNDSDNADT